MSHLGLDILTQVMLRTQHEHLGLDTQSLQLLHAGLGGFRLQLTGSSQIRHIGEVDV